MKPVFRTLIAILLIAAMLPLAACGQSMPSPAGETPAGTAETAAPTAEPTPEPTPYEVPADLPLRISEVMPSNKATLAAGSLFPDWVELHNAGEEPVSLRNVFLCCGTDSFELGEGELAADAYMIVFCDDSGLSGHAPFSIAKEGESLALRTDRGVILDEFELPACEADRSACRAEDGSIFVTSMVTPGYANTPEGFSQYLSGQSCDSPLQISEVMVFKQFGDSPKGVGSDWVELKNVSGGDVQLSEYYLSDSAKDRLAYRLPEQVLSSGEYALIYCDGTLDGGVYAPFRLDSQREHLYLSRADETLADYVLLERIPYGYSYGRPEGEGGFRYISSPTPGSANGGGALRVSDKPVLLSSEGVFNDVESVEVVLSAQGEIHYTTDGSVPSESSALYTGPLSVSSTSVLRAISVEPGCLASEPLNLSYIINEYHTLPVVSVMGEPDEFFSLGGMYNDVDHDTEIPGAIEYFGEDGSFSLGCGFKLHGDISRKVSGKRTLKVCFRSRYEGNLHYDLFGNGITEFDSILLGIYGIREAHSADHYANHYGYDADTVSCRQRLWDRSSVPGEACEFALSNNLVDDDNFDYVAQYLDMDSLIGWTILQAWCANYDCNPSNVRYYYSTTDNVMHFGLSDLDLGMFTHDLFDVPLYGSVNDGVRNNYDFNVLARKVFANRGYQLRMAQQLSDALRGAMSDENVVAMIEGYRETLSPEVPRDMRRWFPGMSENDAVNSWNILVDRMCSYVTWGQGRARQVIDSFVAHTSPRFTPDEVEYYFGDLMN